MQQNSAPFHQLSNTMICITNIKREGKKIKGEEAREIVKELLFNEGISAKVQWG